jgi:5-hydroxyisourate hydrolase
MTISTHVLDTSIGRPAAAVAVVLQRRAGDGWADVAHETTSMDGRAAGLVPSGASLAAGVYRLMFDAGGYFRRRSVDSFYTTIVIEFVVSDAAAHYHVPLLLSPYGYSTYRGS